MKKKIAVVGGGAAGLMAAYAAAKNGNNVTVFEKNSRPARKVMITGKGRCNVTNNCDKDTFLLNTPHGARFMHSAYSAFSSSDTMAFFEEMGVPLKTERGNRVFPVSDKAVDIVDALVRSINKCDVKMVNATVSQLLAQDGQIIGLTLENGQSHFFDKVILATGGMSYSITGSTGAALMIRKADYWDCGGLDGRFFAHNEVTKGEVRVGYVTKKFPPEI